MAVEAKRGCGFRKVGGIYLVAEGSGMPCCKMPLALTICPCCGAGIKQTRGWTWVDAGKLFPSGGCVADPISKTVCPAVNPALMGRVGLLWVGEKFYPRPVDFLNEAAAQGISRRLSNVPRNFKPGETWVLFAHPKAIPAPRMVEEVAGGWKVTLHDGGVIEGEEIFTVHEEALRRAATLDLKEPLYTPGVIRISRPRGFEKIVKQSDFDAAQSQREAFIAAEPEVGFKDAEEKKDLLSQFPLYAQFQKDAARGIIWVPVPDDDPDHVGNVYDDAREEEKT